MNLKGCAHLGDALWEVIVREKAIFQTEKLESLHKLTVQHVNAKFQSELVDYIKPFLNEQELEILRRSRNIKISSIRKINPQVHKIATSFEALLGFLYLENRKRYEEIVKILEKRLFQT